MNHAERSDGEVIFLRDRKWTRQTLCTMRVKYEFFCPLCKQHVILKLGNRQAWHFSHMPVSSCPVQQTNETTAHLKVKEAVFKWLTSFGFHPRVECYLPELKRRPDIFVELNGSNVVLEVQKSAIDPDMFFKRHFAYEDAGYIPVWIGIERNRIRAGPQTTAVFNQLEAMLIRTEPFPHMISYSLQENSWLLSSGFVYLQPTKTFMNINRIALSVSPAELFFHPERIIEGRGCPIPFLHSEWRKQTAKKRLAPYLRVSKTERAVLRLFQEHHLSLNYFPALCNLPLPAQYMLITPPHLWQSWLVMACINKSPLNRKLRLSELTDMFEKATGRLQFIFRPSAVHKRTVIRQLLQQYFELLCMFGVLVQTYPGVYNIRHHVTLLKPLQTLMTDDDYVLNKLFIYFETKNKL